MTDIDKIADLMREKATKADKGPWYADCDRYGSNGIGSVGTRNPDVGFEDCITGNYYAGCDGADVLAHNAEHIAASDPPNVLAILADRDRLRTIEAAAKAVVAAVTHDPDGIGGLTWSTEAQIAVERLVEVVGKP